MDNIKTSYKRSKYDGWQGNSRLRVSATRVLLITTRKGPGALVSSAQCVTNEGDGFDSFLVFGDYSERLLATSCARVTEKAVREQHERLVSDERLMKDLVARTEQFYRAKQVKSETQAPSAVTG